MYACLMNWFLFLAGGGGEEGSNEPELKMTTQ